MSHFIGGVNERTNANECNMSEYNSQHLSRNTLGPIGHNMEKHFRKTTSVLLDVSRCMLDRRDTQMSHRLGILSPTEQNKPVGVVALSWGRSSTTLYVIHMLGSVTSICTHCVCLITRDLLRLERTMNLLCH